MLIAVYIRRVMFIQVEGSISYGCFLYFIFIFGLGALLSLCLTE